VSQKTYANGKSTTYSYYAANQRLKKIVTSGLQNFSYTYDNVGNIKSIADGVSGKTENFGYDDLDRLTTAGDNSYNLQYQYNAVGNMLTQIKDNKTTLFTYGSNAGPHAVTGISSPVPAVGSVVINNGNVFTNTNVVTLNNISMGTPTYFMASENRNFSGASWQAYSTAPTFLLSARFGMKTVYFKVMNADGESNVKSDTIEFRMNPADAYLDDDGDGLTNMMEFLYGTNPYKKDTDGDGKTDYSEVFGGKSSPNSPDSDKDGLDDSKDPYPSNPYHIDFSENYALRHALNEGGGSRSRSAYMISDSLGNGFGKEVIPLQSHPALSATPDPVDFKIVSVGKTRNIGLTITNSGIAGLSIQSISFTGLNRNEFTKINDACSGHTVQPSSTCSLDVVFAPISAGPKAADLNIQSNAPATPQKNVSLFGECVTTSTVEVCDGIDNDFNPNTPDGSQESWYESQTTCGKGVCVNTGQYTCVNGVKTNTCTTKNPTGNDSNCNGIDENCDGIPDNSFVPITKTCGVGVCEASGQIICLSGAQKDTCIPKSPTENTEQSCKDLLDNDCDGMVDCEDPDCGSVCLGHKGVSAYFDTKQRWLVVAYTEPAAVNYSVYLKVLDADGNLIPAGSIAGLPANPSKAADDAINTAVGLAFDTESSTAKIRYSGTSGMKLIQVANIAPPCAPVLELSTDSLPFNTVCNGSNNAKTISVCNDGNCPLNIIGITPPSAPFNISRNTCGSTVAPQACCEIDVRLSPTSANTYSSSVVINTNDGFATVGLSGTAQACGPKIQVTPNSLDFQSVRLYATSDKIITVSNTGATSLSIADVTSPVYPFTKVVDSCRLKTLTPGGSCVITIRFAPYSRTTFNGSIIVKSNDVNVTVGLTGQGN
jgi:hypothetical protein